jgi:hypothetical protein
MLDLVLLTAVAVLGTFIVPVLLTHRQDSHRAQDTFVSSGHVMPKVIQNSSIAYAIGLATLAPLLAWGISGEFWPAVVYNAIVGLGLSLIYVLRRPLLQFLDDALIHDRSITVHEYIARCHGNDRRVRMVAAALTVFAVCGLIVCEMLGLATVLKPLLSGSALLAETFVAAVFLVVMACTIFSGHTGIMHAAQLQLGLLYFGLFGSTACLSYLQVSELGTLSARGTLAIALIAVICAVMHFQRRARYVDTNLIRHSAANNGTAFREHAPVRLRLLSRFQKILNSLVGVLAVTLIVFAIVVAALELYVGGASTVARDSLTALQAGPSVSKMTLISLILLPLLHPIADIANWQRLAAFAKSRDWNYFKEGQWTAAFKSFCATYAVEVPLMGLFICLFGAVAGLTLATPSQGNVTQAFIARLVSQENSVAVAVLLFLLLGLFAIAVSTMGSLFAAGLCAVRYDIVPMFWPEPTSALRSVVEEGRATRLTLIGGLGIGLAALAAFHLAGAGFEDAFAGARFLGLVFGFSSAQLSFAPLVLAPLIAGAGGIGTLTPTWALAVLIVSGAIGIGITMVGLVVGYESSLSWVVPGCLGSAASLFVIASLSHRWTAAGR